MILSIANLRKTKNYLKKNGIKSTIYASVERIYEKKKNKYTYEAPSEDVLEKQRAYQWTEKPLLSLVVPAYETKTVFMEDLILSVADQTYQNYELIIADASESRQVEKVVKELSEEYEHIVYQRLNSNDGISENTNRGIEIATGDYIGLLDHDDLLTPDALFEIAYCIEHEKKRGINPTLIYTDEDKTNTYLEYYYEPNRKGPLNKDKALTNNYICHLSFYRKDVIKELLLRKDYDGAQDYDLVLRTMKYTETTYSKQNDVSISTIEKKDNNSENNWEKYICHVPKILYHWRCHDASTAENPQSKLYAYEAGKRAVEDYLKAMNIKAEVSHLKHLGFYRVNYENYAALFANRKDIGIIGGPVYGKGGIWGREIVGGAMNAKGQVIYKALPENFSGIMHRAVLQQNVAAVDIRNMIIRKELEDLFYEVFDFHYKDKESYFRQLDQEFQKMNKQEKEKIIQKNIEKSLKFCNKAKKRNINILYDPELMEIENDTKG